MDYEPGTPSATATASRILIRQALAAPGQGWDPAPEEWRLPDAQVAFLFGDRERLADQAALAAIRRYAPEAILFGCSTAGEILGESVLDGALTLTLVRFSATRVLERSIVISGSTGIEAGAALSASLPAEDLVHVLVLGNGLGLNGTALLAGIRAGLAPGVSLSGGLAADGDRFEQTLVLTGGEPRPDVIAALGFYGSALRVGTASYGGWSPFGSERRITRAEGNVLYELDGRPALDLYRSYLGHHAAELPAAGLRIPLGIRHHLEDRPVVRTISAIDPENHSVSFFGEIPQGGHGRLMKATNDALIGGAREAAAAAHPALEGVPPSLALLISCLGRRQVLRQRIEEETEAVGEAVGGQAALCGFYSYGEIGPAENGQPAELHNQTMTVTLFGER